MAWATTICSSFVLLERLDDYADAEALHEAFDDFIAEYGAPTKGP